MRNRDPKLVAAALLVFTLFAILISAVMAEPFSPTASSPRSRTGEGIGMEAKGMDAWTAWRNSGSLDVRDELNRPVSTQKIESQVRDASIQQRRQASFSSSLPRASQAVVWLERVKNGFSNIRIGITQLPYRCVEALPWIFRPMDKLLLCMISAYLIISVASARFLKFGTVQILQNSCLSIPLRC